MDLITKYFPNLTEQQLQQFGQLQALYAEWNAKINVVSRKDIDNLYERHVLHSLSIAKVIDFVPGSKMLDVGTGGGFPGIPLAILFPESQFHCIDAIGKKISVVNGVAEALGLANVKGEHIRVEKVKGKYDFVLSRAVTRFDKFRKLVAKNISKTNNNSLKNGILYIKGGDFQEELEGVEKLVSLHDITQWFNEEFFETKKVIHLPIQ
jgi:16S rRNA (guanine527-N7)-methyltransferase